jgi:hypothetical protein
MCHLNLSIIISPESLFMNKIIEHTFLNDKSRSQAVHSFRAISDLSFREELEYRFLVALAAGLDQTDDLVRPHEQGSLYIHLRPIFIPRVSGF